MYLLRVHFNKRSAKGFIRSCLCNIFSDFLYKRVCFGYSFELYLQVHAIQMGTYNICLYKVDKNYTSCNTKTTELLDRVLIGVCVVIRSNTLCCGTHSWGASNEYPQHAFLWRTEENYPKHHQIFLSTSPLFGDNPSPAESGYALHLQTV